MLTSKEGPEISGIEQTLLKSAVEAEEKRDYGRALQFYKQLEDRNSKHTTYKLGIADNLRRLQQMDEALSYYDAVLKKQPDHIGAMEGKGLVLLSKTEFKQASEVLEKVMAEDPKRWRTLNAIGILFVSKEMPQEAMAYYEEALSLRPDEPTILNNVGLTLALNGDYDRAIKALQRASLKLSNDKGEQKKRADLNLALVYGIAGDLEMAEQVSKPHLSESALNNNLGFYAYLADNVELARGYLNNAISGSPQFYEKAWNNLEAIGGSKLKNSHKPPKNVKKPKSIPMVLVPSEPEFAPEEVAVPITDPKVIVERAKPVEPLLGVNEQRKLALSEAKLNKDKAAAKAKQEEPLQPMAMAVPAGDEKWGDEEELVEKAPKAQAKEAAKATAPAKNAVGNGLMSDAAFAQEVGNLIQEEKSKQQLMLSNMQHPSASLSEEEALPYEMMGGNGLLGVQSAAVPVNAADTNAEAEDPEVLRAQAQAAAKASANNSPLVIYSKNDGEPALRSREVAEPANTQRADDKQPTNGFESLINTLF